MTFRPRKPTDRSVVLEFLTGADDFCTVGQVTTGTGLTRNKVMSALHGLYKCAAIDCMQADGTLLWYATPESDRRQSHHDLRKAEETRNFKKRRKGAKYHNWRKNGPPGRRL